MIPYPSTHINPAESEISPEPQARERIGVSLSADARLFINPGNMNLKPCGQLCRCENIAGF